MRVRVHVITDSLLRFEVSVDDPQCVEVVQRQGQLCQVELDIVFGKHHLGEGGGYTMIKVRS